MENIKLGDYGSLLVSKNTTRYRNGKPTGEKTTVIFVKEKLTESELLSRGIEKAPSYVDVVEVVGGIQLYQEKVRPLIGGLSLGVQGFNIVSTLGCIAYDKTTGKKRGVLNRHCLGYVLKEANKLNSPALLDIEDGGGGTLADFNIGFGVLRSEEFDAAAIEVTVDASVNQQYNIGATVAEFAEAKQNMLVQKNGRTTGHTWGKVEMFVQIKHPTLALEFQNDILIEGVEMEFGKGGDSGSCIYTEDGKLVALLWGGLSTSDGRNFTIAHPIEPVFDSLNLSLTKPNIIELPNTKPMIVNKYQTKAYEFAMKFLGETEIKGTKHNYVIQGQMLRACNLLNRNIALAYKDETSWCALGLIASILDGVNNDNGTSRYLDMFKYLGINEAAISFKRLAVKGKAITLDNAQLGDIVVIYTKGKSTWQRHVGIYVTHDDKHVKLYGGNQSNSWSFADFKVSNIDTIVRAETAFENYRKVKSRSLDFNLAVKGGIDFVETLKQMTFQQAGERSLQGAYALTYDVKNILTDLIEICKEFAKVKDCIKTKDSFIESAFCVVDVLKEIYNDNKELFGFVLNQIATLVANSKFKDVFIIGRGVNMQIEAEYQLRKRK